MLYDRLDKIPLDIFIDVYAGEVHRLIIEGEHSPEELKQVAQKLIDKYMSISSSKGYQAMVYSHDKELKAQMNIQLMEMLLDLLKMGREDAVVEILNSRGYRVSASNVKHMEKIIRKILKENELTILRKKSIKTLEKPTPDQVKDRFLEEVANIMLFHGHTFDKSKISAQEYANFVKIANKQSLKKKK